MLLNDLILDKKGTLSKVWLSAHHERKLSKQQALGVNVNESVDAILAESRPMALRVSGQLMLGVVRIYGRKVQYLMDDCRDTRERITMTFRPGAVDLPQDQIRASRNAITFEPAGQFDALDMFDWGNFDMPADEGARGLHTAPLAQTNLRTREYGAFNFGRPKAASIYGDSDSRAGSVDDSTQHLDSQDFQPIDLDLGLDDFSMELGREARSERSRSKSLVPRSPSVVRDMDVDQTFDAGFDVGGEDFAPIDLGLGDLPELEEEAPALSPPAEIDEDDDARRRQSSELSTPPPPDENETLDLTPRVAKRLAEAKSAPKNKRVRLVRADDELELPDELFANPTDDSDILGEENFVPANPEALRLREIMDDPVGHFLPTVDNGLFTGPTGLASELAELFTFPLNVLRRARTEEPPETPRPAKKRKASEHPEEDDEVEAARREERLPSVAFDGGFEAAPFEDMGLDLTLDNIQRSPTRSRDPSIAPILPSSPPPDGEHRLAAFDARNMSSQVASSQAHSDKETQLAEAGGFSKNTALAMGVLRRELDAIEDEDKKEVSLKSLARGATKRAAAGMFFELLVLGTRDAVTLQQNKPFGDIHVRAKDRFYELA